MGLAMVEGGVVVAWVGTRILEGMVSAAVGVVRLFLLGGLLESRSLRLLMKWRES